MTNEPKNELDISEAMDIIRRTAQAIINHPDSITINNYKDAFDILAQGCPEKLTKEFKDNILNRLGVKE